MRECLLAWRERNIDLINVHRLNQYPFSAVKFFQFLEYSLRIFLSPPDNQAEADTDIAVAIQKQRRSVLLARCPLPSCGSVDGAMMHARGFPHVPLRPCMMITSKVLVCGWNKTTTTTEWEKLSIKSHFATTLAVHIYTTV